MIRKLFIAFGLSLWPAVCFAFASSAPGLAPISKTSNYPLTCSDNGTYFDNAGATGTVTFTLPSAPCVGQINCFTVVAPFTVNVALPGGSTLWLGTSSATGQFQATQEASSLCEYAQSATTFVAYSYSAGSWTGTPQTITSITLSGGQKFVGGAASGTNISNITVGGADNGAATLALSGPDANLFQLSSGCTAANCTIQSKGQTVTGGTGGVSSTILTVTSGTLYPGMVLTGGTGVTVGTKVIALGSAANTYVIAPANTITAGTSNITAVADDGLFHIYLTATLGGARGSGVKYPFEIAGTVACSTTLSNGFTQANLTTAIGNASGSSLYTICLPSGGSGTISSSVAVNKNNIRITGVNSVATTGAWYSAVPSITVSGQIIAFNVSSNPVTIDHISASGTLQASTADSCTGQSVFMADAASLASFTAKYNQTSTFMCDYWLVNTSAVTSAYNYMNGSGFVGMVCDPCGTSIFPDNQEYNPTDKGEPNDYPFVVSGDGVSSSVTWLNNSVFNPIWECFDNHGSTDIHWLNNYCVGAARIPSGGTFANTAMNSPGNGGQAAIRPWQNGNFLDRGAAAAVGMNTIVQEAGSGGSPNTLTCGTSVGVNDCEVENNTVLFGALDNSSCGLFATGAAGGTLTGTQTISGNTCGGAMATMAAPTLTTDQSSNGFVANQANGIIGALSVVMTPAFPSWVTGWPNYGGWPGTFAMCEGAGCSTFTSSTTHFKICVDGQHVCQVAAGVPAGSYALRFQGTLAGLNNSPQSSAADVTVTGS